MIWERYDYTISNNTARLNGGAIYAEGTSQIKFYSSVTLTGNIAEGNGGAMFISNSHASIGGREVTDKVFVTFSSNEACKEGGAIYVRDNDCSRKPFDQNPCFNVQYNNKKYLRFVNNTAADGSVLYGGMLDRCMVDTLPSPELGIKVIKNISEYEDTPLSITSDPIICLCIDNKPDCSTREKAYTKMSGQAIHLVGTAVDQDNNQKASMITARYTQPSAELAAQESSAEFSPVCQDLIYHIKTDNSSARLLLQATGRCEITINFEVKCAVGFQVHKDGCKCDERLTGQFGNSVHCDYETGNFTQKGINGSTWIQYHGDKLRVNTHCPLGYCQDKSDIIDLEHPDEQCANNRGGVLCGGCRENFTLALVGFKCIECSSKYALVWIIPVFALAGVALVVLLLVCNMTVSHGTLNGLIFYANIVSITGLTNLQNCSIHPKLSIFIACINLQLDFGIESCFYSGMDSYYKTLLQFAFPLYIVLLVGVIALVSHYSTTAVKVFGRNNIAILTTLFFLSYTTILKTIFTALDVTQVYQGSANDTNLVPYNVWTYNGNVEYLKGKHIPLFGVAMTSIFIFLPYTLLLTFGQCIRALPTERWCVLKFTTSTSFISIMDAYHAPYHPTHRYWTGLMLLVRCAIFLAFFFSFRGSELEANMFITTLILISIFTLKVFFKKIYKNFLLNILELAFLLNLICLSVTVLYLKNNNIMNSDICTFTSVSISVSLAMFTGILSYHAYLQLNKTRCFISIKRELAKRNLTRLYRRVPDDDDYYPPPPPPPPLQKVGVQRLPTTTTVGLHEEELQEATY